jgi:hypothetical protein
MITRTEENFKIKIFEFLGGGILDKFYSIYLKFY